MKEKEAMRKLTIEMANRLHVEELQQEMLGKLRDIERFIYFLGHISWAKSSYVYLLRHFQVKERHFFILETISTDK